MPVTRAAIFIDGGYLDWVIKSELNRCRLDYQKFSAALAGDKELLRTYYYHCEPYQSSHPTTEESARFASMQSFLYRLKQLPRFEVRLG